MPDTEVRECRKCDILWGLIGTGFGLIILTLGIDLLSGGALTRAVLSTGPKLATVTPIRREADDDAG